jgi:hypothetical protein
MHNCILVALTQKHKVQNSSDTVIPWKSGPWISGTLQNLIGFQSTKVVPSQISGNLNILVSSSPKQRKKIPEVSFIGGCSYKAKILAQKISSKLFEQCFPPTQFDFCHSITFVFDCEVRNFFLDWTIQYQTTLFDCV